eukprot:SAG31_NODE_872_length_11329_cov_3.968655_7_plen_104_part_00
MPIDGLLAAERPLDMLKCLDATIEECAGGVQNALHDELAEATATRRPAVRSCGRKNDLSQCVVVCACVCACRGGAGTGGTGGTEGWAAGGRPTAFSFVRGAEK